MKNNVLLLFFLYFASAQCQNLPCFNTLQEPSTFSVGNSPVCIITADFNLDGVIDLATSNNGSGNITILEGNGNGSFQAGVNYPAGTSPRQLISKDFDSDGDQDIAVVNQSSGDVSILLGSPSGTFAPAVNYTVVNSPFSITSSDFDNDGNLDLIVTGTTTYSVSLLLGNGNGTFAQAANIGFFMHPWISESGDFNLDGKADVVFINYLQNTISVYMGQGNGAFLSGVTYTVNNDPRSIVVKDLNSDGNLDFVFNNLSASFLSVMLGSASGTFAPAVHYTTAGYPGSIIVEDFNGDSKQDIISGNPDCISILLGNGVGTFSAAANYGDGDVFLLIASADLDQDGDKDVINLQTGANKVRVLRALGNATFLAPLAYNVPGVGFAFPNSMLTDDLNNDGLKDILMNCINTPSLMLFKGSTASVFTSPYQYSLPGSMGMNCGDLNNDGYKDVVIGATSTGQLNVLMGSATGTFAPPIGYVSLSPNPSMNLVAVAIADFDEDGNQDVVVPGSLASSPRIMLYKGSSSGTLSLLGHFPTPVSALSLTQADFNGDSNADIAAAGVTGLSVFLGNGAGSFSASANYTLVSVGTKIISDDFNSDGNPDLAVSHYGTGQVSVLLGSSSGTFSPAVVYGIPGNTSGGPRDIISRDFNGDTYPDLVTANYGTTTISFLLGSNSGTFSPPYNFELGSQGPRNLVAADFNGDSREDIAVAMSSGVVALLISNLPVITVSGTFSVCNGYSVSLSASGATSYTWSTGALGNQAAVSPTVTTTYSVAGTGQLGCSFVASKEVTVISTPSISAQGGSVCIGNSFTLSPSGATTYTFEGGSPVVQPSVTTTYSIAGTNALGCVSPIPATVTITAVSAPLPTITVNSGTLCEGSSFTITPAGAFTYTISGNSSIVSPTLTSSYTVSGTSQAGCVGSQAVSTVTVYPAPVLQINSAAICTGSQFTLIPTGALTYTYSGGSAVINPSVTTSYSVTGTSSDGCISLVPAIGQITVAPLPVLSVTSSHSVLCAGETATLQCSGALTYLWDTQQPDSVITIAPMTNTTCTVQGISAFGCASNGFFMQVVDVCAGLLERDLSDQNVLFPNPGSEIFQLRLTTFNPEDYVTVVNSKGESINHSQVKANELSVNMAGQPAGLYLLILRQGKTTTTFKFIKE